MKKIKDYLHLYIPCRCIRTDTNQEMLLVGIDNHGENWHPDDKCVKFEGALWKWSDVERLIKPVLRPLSNIQPDEDKECNNIMFGDYAEKFKGKNIIHYEGEKIKYLLKKGFDVFGLIDANLAVSFALSPV